MMRCSKCLRWRARDPVVLVEEHRLLEWCCIKSATSLSVEQYIHSYRKKVWLPVLCAVGYGAYSYAM